MRQLTGLDASFLHVENERNHGHTSGLMILDTSEMDSPLTIDTVRELMAERLPFIPAFRWRLVEVPLGIDHPYWADSPEVDLEFHIREIAIPAPFTPEKLSEQVSRIQSRTLDRTRPLWEMYLIHGLEDGRVGLLTKFHHAVADGMSAAEILGRIVDTSPERAVVTAVEPVVADEIPEPALLLLKGLVNLLTSPLRLLQLHAKLASPVISATVTAVKDRSDLLAQKPAAMAPRVSFSGAIGSQRRWAYGTMPMPVVKEIKNHYGCTVNDVVMSVVTSAVRQWLLDHDELPEERIVAGVPTSFRSKEQAKDLGNKASVMFAPLPTDLDDPVERLMATKASMDATKAQFRTVPTPLLMQFSDFALPAQAEMAARVSDRLRMADRVAMPANLVVSNVPGPRQELYFAGARVVGNHPISMVSDGMGLNVTLISHGDNLDYGIVVDREMIPDVWNLSTYLDAALDELHAGVSSKSHALAA